MTPDQEREAFEKWASLDERWPQAVKRDATGETYLYAQTQKDWTAWQARAALQHSCKETSQDREEIMEMALCESRRLALRIGQAYRFVPMEGCKTCEEMKEEHDQAYTIDHASRVERGDTK